MQKFKNAVFRATTSLSSDNIEETIVVTGSPRSGTTWLSELLRELPNYKMLNEPLNLNSSVLARNVEGLDWRTHIPREEEFPALKQALRQALTGQVEWPHMWRFQSDTPLGRLLETATNRKLIVKLIRAGRMLSWFSKQFPVRAIVSTFRHPCAVVASQVKYQTSWEEAEPPAAENIQSGFGGHLPDAFVDRFGAVLANIDSTVGYLAAVWSIDTYLTLQGPIHGNWIVTTYEDLVDEPGREMDRLFGELQEPIPRGVNGRLTKPSNSAADDLKTEDPSAQLSKWRSRLTDGQIESVLRVVKGFGLDDVYSRALRPNHDALKNMIGDSSASLPARS